MNRMAQAHWILLTHDPETGKFYSPAEADGSLIGFASKNDAIEAGCKSNQRFYVVCPELHHRARWVKNS